MLDELFTNGICLFGESDVTRPGVIGYSGLRFTSTVIGRYSGMGHSKAPIPTGTHKRPLSLWHFARFAAFLTLGSAVVILITAFVQGNHEVWALASILCLWTTLVVWIVALTIGCLVMVPVGIWRISKRLARKGVGKTVRQGRLWDRWIDGPQPL